MSGRRRITALLALVVVLAACSRDGWQRADEGERLRLGIAQTLERLRSHCGQAYAGRVVVDEPATAGGWPEPLLLHVRACEPSLVALSIAAGEDRSRVWILTENDGGDLFLQHQHHRDDASPEAYSGFAVQATGADDDALVLAPDARSRTLLESTASGPEAGATWTFSVGEDTLRYRIDGARHRLQLDFDLRDPVQPPPLPWFEAPLR